MGDFLMATYCQRANPISKKWDNGQSLVWKYMMKNKLKIENHIQWHLSSGSTYFWWDNLLRIVLLAYFRTNTTRPNNIKVLAFLNQGHQNVERINHIVPVQVVPQILAHQFYYNATIPDKVVWQPNSDGNFTFFISLESHQDEEG